MLNFDINTTLPEINTDDLESIQVPEFKRYIRLPDGYYNFKCIDLDIYKENTIVLTFQVCDGDYAGQMLKYFSNAITNEKARYYFLALLKALGYTNDEIKKMSKNLSRYLPSLLELNVAGKVTTKHYEDTGKSYTNITQFYNQNNEYANPKNILTIYENKLNVLNNVSDKFKEETGWDGEW